MGKKATKKNAAASAGKQATPMPNLVYNGGDVENETPKNTSFAPVPPPTREPPTLRNATLERYNQKNERLMMFAVVGLAVIVGGLWLFSITTQFSLVRWAKTPEKNLLDATSDSWRQAFHTDTTSSVSIDELKTEIKNRLSQITAEFVSSTTSTPARAVTSTPSLPSTTIQLKK